MHRTLVLTTTATLWMAGCLEPVTVAGADDTFPSVSLTVFGWDPHSPCNVDLVSEPQHQCVPGVGDPDAAPRLDLRTYDEALDILLSASDSEGVGRATLVSQVQLDCADGHHEDVPDRKSVPEDGVPIAPPGERVPNPRFVVLKLSVPDLAAKCEAHGGIERLTGQVWGEAVNSHGSAPARTPLLRLGLG